MSDLYITPPGLGQPTDLNSTSNFSTWVVEQRELDGRKGTHYLMCCGHGNAVLGIFTPVPNTHLNSGATLNISVFASYIPFGGHGMVTLVELGLNVHLNESGWMMVSGLPDGTHTLEATIVDVEGERAALVTDRVQIAIGNAEGEVGETEGVFMLEENRDYIDGNVPHTHLPLHDVPDKKTCLRRCVALDGGAGGNEDKCIAFTFNAADEEQPDRSLGCHLLVQRVKPSEVVDLGEGRRAQATWGGVRLGKGGGRTMGRWTRCMPLRSVCLMVQDP
mmetsp:Transcript_20569/g.44562  ORF Transcript_20569/g.44562 Transcript_20569/m.44562 type:complete len:276 (+) Transcript_20569:97-924(+)